MQIDFFKKSIIFLAQCHEAAAMHATDSSLILDFIIFIATDWPHRLIPWCNTPWQWNAAFCIFSFCMSPTVNVECWRHTCGLHIVDAMMRAPLVIAPRLLSGHHGWLMCCCCCCFGDDILFFCFFFATKRGSLRLTGWFQRLIVVYVTVVMQANFLISSAILLWAMKCHFATLNYCFCGGRGSLQMTIAPMQCCHIIKDLTLRLPLPLPSSMPQHYQYWQMCYTNFNSF